MSLYNIASSLNLNILSKEKMYENIKLISNYIDTKVSLSKCTKTELEKIIDGLQNYINKNNLSNKENITFDNEQHIAHSTRGASYQKTWFSDNEQHNIIESPLTENQRIIAGAGSGKTTTILYRIKYLLDNFTMPDRILVLTFNRDSAQNIKNRISLIFGFPIKINIFTIDAFCYKLINKYNKLDNINISNYSLSEYCTLGLKIMKKYSVEISQQFRYIFFDEFQDVNDTQFNILKLFVDNGCFLTVIGDDCQNIYQFRGTNNYYMINFDRIISNSKTYFLQNNYRSTKNIVDIANKSISFNTNRVHKIMNPIKDYHKKPKLIIYKKEESIYNNIIQKINKLINNGIKYDDICILSRNSYPLKMIETELTKYNIPHTALITDKNTDDTTKLIEPNKIVLTTIHKSKGLEWSFVFIIGLNHTHFPEHLNNNIKNIEEERRLFYVAITRCKLQLYFIAHQNELPLSIFIKEIHSELNIINKTNEIIENMFSDNIIDENNIKNNYSVTDLINLFNEIDLEELRNLDLIPNIQPEIKVVYQEKKYFIESIKHNSFESDLGEFCDRYITRGIINKLNIDFADIDTEIIIKDSENKNIDAILLMLLNKNHDYIIKKKYQYPTNVISKIINSYINTKNKNLSNDDIINDIYWISLCRNFVLDRKRLLYRDIFNLIQENMLLIKNRMDDYINHFSQQDNIKCKQLVKYKQYIKGEIDLISNDMIIDFKCSESDFKLEWLLQLLLYFVLYNNNNINKLCIINILNGQEYIFTIPEIYKNNDYRSKIINYLDTKIQNDQQSIRNYPSIDFNLLNNNNINNNNYITNSTTFNYQPGENFMVLDTETADLNGDIIQLAYIIVDKNQKIIKTFNKYIKDRISTYESILIHNITIDTLRTKGEDFYCVLNEFIKDLETINYIVGHNVNYDLRAIINNLRKYDFNIKTSNKHNYNIFNQIKIFDTFLISKKSLNNLYIELYNMPIVNAHDALADVMATYKCYIKIGLQSNQYNL
jgi:hypothetical protein